MKKLSFFTLLLVCMNFIACGDLLESGTDAVLGCTDENSFNYDPNATVDDGTCVSMIGCTGYNPQINQYGQIINTFGDPYYDQKFAEEVAIQREFYQGVPAEVILIKEQRGMNAFASPDGYILFGSKIFRQLLQDFGELPIAGVLAHEWAHRTQFTFFSPQDYAQPAHQELEADAFAGFYMFLAKQWAWSKVDSYYKSVFASGDTYFNSPSHHGTSQERLAAAHMGVFVADYAMKNGYQYSYEELHNYFLEHIKTVIKPRSSSGAEPMVYDEIEFPENVTAEQARALFPKK